MCGILALLDFTTRGFRPETVIRLRDTMFHRGPDDAGLYIEGPVALAHRRLSIIDLTPGGHQPMSNEDDSLQLVFNGEIYNYVELRNELRRRGHRFSSSTDSEVILHQYEEDGEACVDKLRGMFAFALWDSKRRRLFAARDRFGIKPLYYYVDSQKLILASEIKAIVADEEVPRRPDFTALADYLYVGRALGSKTMFRDVAELEPGCCLMADLQGTVQARRYWELRYDYDFSRTQNRVVDDLFSIVDDSMQVHCRSDAPLGCHLSGGLDSSSVVAFAARHREHLKAFSIKFSDDAHIDETRYARAAARHVGAEYLECSPTALDMAAVLPSLVWHMDMPMATEGGFAYFTVSEFAQRSVKVALTGHGGDELFAGYPAQFQAAFNSTDMFRLFEDPDRIPKPEGWINKLRRKGPRGVLNSIRNRATGATRSLEDLWVLLHCDYLPREHPLVHPEFVAAVRDYSPRDAYLEPFKRAQTQEVLDKCLFHDLNVYLPSLLHLEDRVSMAVSIESRVPLLDHHIAEFLATVPPGQKVPDRQPKHLLRRAASSLLPEEVWSSKEKRPFGVPGTFWKSTQLSQVLSEVLLSRDSTERGMFTARGLREVCRDPRRMTLFWSLVNIELWFKLFIDRNPLWLERATPHPAAPASA